MKSRLRQILEAFTAAKLTLRPSKCTFATQSIEFLGYVLSTDGLRPGANKLEAIKLLLLTGKWKILQFSIPKNEHEVRRFIGLASFFRRFVPKFAENSQLIRQKQNKI